MFTEIRKQGKKKKYYLVHSYRLGNNVKRISRYLGSNLKENQIEKLKKRAEALILGQIKGKNPYEFELSREEIEYYKKFDHKIKVEHLQSINWERFTKQFTYNTNAIEGSTVEYSEVKELIEKKQKPNGEEEIETVNVADAVTFIKNTKEKFSIALIKKLHKICFMGTKHFAGNFRDVEVVIRDGFGNIVHQGAPADMVEKLLSELVKWYDKHKKKYPPLMISAIIHNQFEKIHPFQDGNGRVGRLLLNYILLKLEYPPINIRLKDRQRYYKCLQEYDKAGDIKTTLTFLIQEYKKQYK
ncbi:MAG: Fic family protein [Candidatus Woesearchaeota archaeon]